jgi:hypothetical protein
MRHQRGSKVLLDDGRRNAQIIGHAGGQKPTPSCYPGVIGLVGSSEAVFKVGPESMAVRH